MALSSQTMKEANILYNELKAIKNIVVITGDGIQTTLLQYADMN